MISEPSRTPRSALLPALTAAVLAPFLLLLPARDAAAMCEGSAATRSAATRSAAPEGRLQERALVLTIDAAWEKAGAQEILDALRSHDVRATFFLTGRFVRCHPEIARRIAAEGHEVGSHTYHHAHLTRYGMDGSHATLPGVTAESLQAEMKETCEAFSKATGRLLAPIWRAPYGETNTEILAWARDCGYMHVGWSKGLDALDWVSDPSSRLYQPPLAAVERILGALERRSPSAGPAVILMHLGSTRAPGDRFGRALPSLIEGARRLGYRFAAVRELLWTGELP